MILVTSASGHVGTSVVRALVKADQPVRAFVHSERGLKLKDLGVQDIIIGDLLEPAHLRAAFEGVTKVFHIGPPEHPRELAIGQTMIDLAQEHGVEQFVYFSVLHPFISALRHHWNKLLVQEYLVDSGVPYTILQPTMFMRSPQEVVERGVLAVPYAPDQPMSVVDLEDVADAAVKVLSDAGHLRAIYDLVGDQPLSNRDMADIISRVSGKTIKVQQLPLDVVMQGMSRGSATEVYGAESLERMFVYYGRHGLMGSPNILGFVLGRPPTTFEAFVRRSLGG
jgi:uncharacterized protein YbjT (DUF2867 family)